MDLALWTARASFRSTRIAPVSRVTAFSWGKMPTTLVFRLISPWRHSSGLVTHSLARCAAGKVSEARTSCSASSSRAASYGTSCLSWSATRSPWAEALAASSWAQTVATQAALLAGRGEQVAHALHAAAPPRGTEDMHRGGLQPPTAVGNHQLDDPEPTPGETAQEVGPEGSAQAPHGLGSKSGTERRSNADSGSQHLCCNTSGTGSSARKPLPLRAGGGARTPPAVRSGRRRFRS